MAAAPKALHGSGNLKPKPDTMNYLVNIQSFRSVNRIAFVAALRQVRAQGIRLIRAKACMSTILIMGSCDRSVSSNFEMKGLGFRRMKPVRDDYAD